MPIVRRLVECAGGTDRILFAGSLAVFPIVREGRGPHDVDVLVEEPLLEPPTPLTDAATTIEGPGRMGPGWLPDRLRPRSGIGTIRLPEGKAHFGIWRRDGGTFDWHLGAGVVFRWPASTLERVHWLEWEGARYPSPALEQMFVFKGFVHVLKTTTRYKAWMEPKHVADLRTMAPFVDWDYAEELVRGVSIRWGRVPLAPWSGSPLRRRLLARMRAVGESG